MKNINFDDFLSPQAQASRKIGPCYDPAGTFIREDAKRDARRRDEDADNGLCCGYDFDADRKWWDAREELVESISRGGGTTSFKK